MPITNLRTFEGVPIGKGNFDNYLTYLRDLTARSNPFIASGANDDNTIISLGSVVSSSDNPNQIVDSSDDFILEEFTWHSDNIYLISYKLTGITFEQTSTLEGTFNVDFEGADSNFVNVDSLAISQNSETEGFLIFSPTDTIIKDLKFSIPVSTDFAGTISLNLSYSIYELSENSLITLTGNSPGSFLFAVNDNNELYALPTPFITSDYATPNLNVWKTPLSFIEKISPNPGAINFVFRNENLPFSFNRLSPYLGSSVGSPVFGQLGPENYVTAKTNFMVDGYEKGFVSYTINGIPQSGILENNENSFYSSEKLIASDIFELKSLRLGAEYPIPLYTNKLNHQYANETLFGFTNVDSNDTDITGLAGSEYQNRLKFPYTDFSLDATLVLVHRKQIGATTDYYYIPVDNTTGNTVQTNHYRVLDFSTGEVEFNFNLNIKNNFDRFFIVSLEQLSQVITSNVTEYFSSYGKLYSPTANLFVPTTILSFNSALLLDSNFENQLPKLSVIPSTKILGSSGGPIFADSEGEFDDSTIYAFSYPGLIDVDEFVRRQVRFYEPDIIDLYYYCGTTAKNFVKTEIPYPVYIKILDNKISWYNRGINLSTYDLVSRADFSSICLTGNVNFETENSLRLHEARRRVSFSSASGIIAPNQTTFISNTFNANSFLANDSTSKITSVPAPNGSLLVGNGNSTPSTLPAGGANSVLTISTNYPAWSNSLNLASITTGSLTTNSLTLNSPATTTTDAVRADRKIFTEKGIIINGVEDANLTGDITLSLTGQALNFHNLNTQGFVVRAGNNSIVTRELIPGTGISIAQPKGGTADTTIGLTGQALALHNFNGTGIIARTDFATYVSRTITGTENQINVTNADGVSNNPTLSLPQNIHTAATPTFGATTINGTIGVQASSSFSAATQFPVFNADPASTTRTIVTRTPAEILNDISAVPVSRTISTSGIATGGGNLTENRTIDVPPTNISQGVRTTNTVLITSSTGSDANLESATTTLAGVMSSADKAKLNGIQSGAQVNAPTNISQGSRTATTVPITSSTGSGTNLESATTTLAGVMSSADKAKLDGVQTGAQVNVPTDLSLGIATGTAVRIDSSTGTDITLPTASPSSAGLVTNGTQIFSGTKQFNGTLIIPIKSN